MDVFEIPHCFMCNSSACPTLKKNSDTSCLEFPKCAICHCDARHTVWSGNILEHFCDRHLNRKWWAKYF